MLAFAIAGAVCIVAALCYAEIASMIPVAGSAYTYSYATMGEFFAWTVGWALIMEYAIAASAVSVGWSGYFSGTVLGGSGDTFADLAQRRATCARRGRGRVHQPACAGHRAARHRPAGHRHERERQGQRVPGR